MASFDIDLVIECAIDQIKFLQHQQETYNNRFLIKIYHRLFRFRQSDSWELSEWKDILYKASYQKQTSHTTFSFQLNYSQSYFHQIFYKWYHFTNSQ